jgi:hypothetical protein
MFTKKTFLAALAAASLSIGVGHANLISNGSFGTGDLTNFTVANYGANGGTGSSYLETVSSFDVTGSGTQNAAKFEVGLTGGGYGGSSVGGISLSQAFFTTGGTVNFSANIAADNEGNLDVGTYVVYIDSTNIASYAFGSHLESGIFRGVLFGSDVLSSGTHDLTIDIYRNYYYSGGFTPLQYIANIDLEGDQTSSVPEPGSLALLGLGLAGLGFSRRKKS